MVVPDSIEPVVGWRCFRVEDGILFSPQQMMPWPHKRRAEALCRKTYRWWEGWIAVTEDELRKMTAKAIEQGGIPEEGQIEYMFPDGRREFKYVYMPWGLGGRAAPAVTDYPPEGKVLALVRQQRHAHVSPGEGCQCGIHIARAVHLALDYQEIGNDFALARVFGWGATIPAHHGFRVQYAYPERIYLASKEHRRPLKSYGVEIMPLLECDEYLDEIGITWR